MWIKMFPNAELDNYKLQVELLYEKLQRSEENRQQLAQKLEQITAKRSEHDKLMHTKARQKYQQFLDEQQKRNERNKMLVQMLERIDQQTAAMSARSERLKMMKLQYEMYFAKLVQTQTMRCIQTSAAPTPIPVLLPTAAPGVIGANTAIKNNESAAATAYRNEAPAPVGSNTVPAAAATAAGPGQTFCLTPRSPCSEATLSNAAIQQAGVAMPLQGQHWTIAMATPTPAGMLLTNSTGTPTNAYDYLQYPFGYAPYMPQPLLARAPQYLEERRDLLPNSRSSSYDDARPTLRDFDKMTDAFPAVGRRVSTAQDFLATQYDNNEFVGATTTAAAAPAAAKLDKCLVEPAAGAASNEDAQQQPTPQHSLSTPSLSSSSLTFDKLPRTSMAMTGKNSAHQPYTAADDDNDKHKDLDVVPVDRQLHAARLASSNNRNALSSQGVEAEISRAVGDMSAPPARQQIDESWQAPPLVQAYDASKSLPTYDKEWAAKPASEVPSSNASERFADAPRVSATQAAGNQSSTAPASSTAPTTTQVSIEKIENAIYGELVNQPPEPVARPDIRNATQELLQDLETQPQTPVVEPQLMAGTPSTAKLGEQQQEAIGGATTDYANYGAYAEEATLSTSSYNPDGSDSYDPTYATIDGNINAEVYAEPAYGEHQQVAATGDYPQYAEASGDAANEAYSNVDYANYDATQYAAEGYDPNAYPGYTYDETTGQYTADDGTQQYAADANYADQDYTQQQQAYDAQLQQQPYDETQQQAANYDYANYATDASAAYTGQEIAAPLPAETAGPSAPPTPAATTEAAPIAPVATTESNQDTPKASGKPPTSILSTPSASAAANEAQKKKKRVNFVDSSETDESSSAKPAGDKLGGVAVVGGGAASSESDFDFSSSGETATKNKP